MSISPSNIGDKEAAPMPNGDIAARVKAAREAVGYSIEDLAVTCGLAVVEINDIENGTDFSPAKLKRVAGALQVPLSHFLPTEM
ncbi:helix-turn-helix transcriptional regulator (plasmid) [Sinorhizobium meliloti WSM1022]|jgi:transcriptional regulator with XRE-family HTH domain|uniref:Transcriptional regulator protein n=5 Tax=Sinorhizobium TaxID=28105 RepID=Q7ANP3_RHIME|nr:MULTISPECIES: helix-turn-helix transcriptional regulator [Sinorhizobium]TWB05444.1 helix-turn-helix protein [Ensifer sp. SEMIA 134]TWB41416.1 helix-turn-helix protein [Ensifer sp. SEMIA 135]AEG07921.1 helix-turn-helix domain protein [Sinorhizobium meliloti BL225C]AEG56321.1 helix-turn-helix domain protein [Sinorhizobium meliloti AK83]AEH83374.1 putative transcriptional regulator protein [Sinorhizobium meliloti SM11]